MADAEDTGVFKLKTRKKAYNSRVRSTYFRTTEELRDVERAAKKAKVPLATFIREAALKLTKKVLAA